MKMSFVTIRVKSMVESLKFYTEIMGLKVVKSFSPQPGTNIVFLSGNDGGMIELIEYENKLEESKESSKSIVSIGISVDNLDEEVKNLESNNVQIVRGPINVPSGERFLFFEDPNGIEIELIEGFEA